MNKNNNLTIKNFIKYCSKNSLYFKDKNAIKMYSHECDFTDNEEAEFVLILTNYLNGNIDINDRNKSINIKNYEIRDLDKFNKFCIKNNIESYNEKSMKLYLNYLEKYSIIDAEFE